MSRTEYTTHARRAGALQMALAEPDEEPMPPSPSPPPLNDTLRETARLTPPPPPPPRSVTPAAYQRAMDVVREALGINGRPINPSLRPSSVPDIRSMPPSDAHVAHRRAVNRFRSIPETHRHHHRALSNELPAPAPLPVQYVRLAHVPRDPRQSPMHGATAMMRTWVLVDDDDLVPPPPLPAAEQRNNPRPPLVLGTCSICLDDKWTAEVVFTGCGHMSTCLPCTQKLLQSVGAHAVPCPLCRIRSPPILVRAA